MPAEKPSTVKDITGYATSRDYVKLVELMKKQSVICIVDCVQSNHTCRCLSKTIYEFGKFEVFEVIADGISRICELNDKDFISLCERRNVEFIVPNAEK